MTPCSSIFLTTQICVSTFVNYSHYSQLQSEVLYSSVLRANLSSSSIHFLSELIHYHAVKCHLQINHYTYFFSSSYFTPILSSSQTPLQISHSFFSSHTLYPIHQEILLAVFKIPIQNATIPYPRTTCPSPRHYPYLSGLLK